MKEQPITTTLKTDVLISGAGLAGYAAAIAAAETGMRVILLEKHNTPGGAAVLANVGTLCGFYYRGPEPLPVRHPLCVNLVERLSTAYPQTQLLSLPEGLHVVSYDKADLSRALTDHLREYNIQYITNATLLSAQADHDRVESVTFLDGKTNANTKVYSQAFVDCTGIGFLTATLGHPMLRAAHYQAAAQVIRFKNVKPTTAYALNLSLRKIMRETHERQPWPEAYLRLSIIPGSLRTDTFDLKLPLTQTVMDSTDLVSNLKNEVDQHLPRLLETFRTIESLAQTTVSEIAPEPGVRIQQRPHGKYILTHHDVTQCTKPQDGIALGTWPIEEWDYDGKVNMTYFPESDGYFITAQALQSPVFQNLYFAGKNISADDKAIASARVTGTCIQTGYAAGKLATCHSAQAQTEAIRHLHALLTNHP